MTSKEIDRYLKQHPSCVRRGAGTMAERLHTTKHEIYEAKAF